MKAIFMTLSVISVISLCSSVKADVSIEDGAIQCSGLYFILTSLPNSEGITPVAKAMGEIYRLHADAQTHEPMTNGELIQARDAAAMQLGDIYDNSPYGVTKTFLWCREWQLEIGDYLHKTGFVERGADMNDDEAREIFLTIPEPPNRIDYPTEAIEEMHPTLVMAFGNWTKGGRMTSGKLKEILKKKMEDSNSLEE